MKKRLLIASFSVFIIFVAAALFCNPSLVRIASAAVPNGTDFSILVDASRDGGAWWCPQTPSLCDPDADHQGKALADYLKSLGFTVTELCQGETITPELLAPFDIIIRANESKAYTRSEVVAYQDYVYKGGMLLLLGDFVRPQEQDTLGLSFGILFQGISRGANRLDTFVPHSITDGVSPLSFGVGSGAVQLSPTAEVLGYLSADTYLDLNDNEVQDADEPIAAAAFGRMAFGKGEIVFSGDTNFWQAVPQPLVDNTISWLLPDPNSHCEGDFDDDGDVDGSDLAVFAADFGRTDCPH